MQVFSWLCVCALAAHTVMATVYVNEQTQITSYDGSIDSTHKHTFQFGLSSSIVTLTPKNTAVLMFRFEAVDGSLLPGRIEFSPRPLKSRSVKHAVGGPFASSSRVVELNEGEYTITLRSRSHTTGDYVLRVFLAGDANADNVITQEDVDIITQKKHLRVHHADYDINADTNRNGYIGRRDIRFAESNLGARVVPVYSTINVDSTPSLAEGALVLESPSTYSNNFIQYNAPIIFRIYNGAFTSTVSDISLSVNSNYLSFTLSDDFTTVTSSDYSFHYSDYEIYWLIVQFSAFDSTGKPISYETVFWPGDVTTSIQLINEATATRTAFSKAASVIGQVGYFLGNGYYTVDQAMSTYSDGTHPATFDNVSPDLSTVFMAVTEGNQEIGVTGFASTLSTDLTIEMTPFHSPIDNGNNDLSLGKTDGWVSSAGAPVYIESHDEPVINWRKIDNNMQSKMLSRKEKSEWLKEMKLSANMSLPVPNISKPELSSRQSNYDISLTTSGLNVNYLHRTFTTPAGAPMANVRYRITSGEFIKFLSDAPSYDWYFVSLRSKKTGHMKKEMHTVDYFMSTESIWFDSPWHQLTIDVDPTGDIVQLDVAVQNLPDGSFDTKVIVDYVTADISKIVPYLAWDIDNGGLLLT